MARKAAIAAVTTQEDLDLKPGISSVEDLDVEIRVVASLYLQVEDRENAMQQELMKIEERFGPELKRLKQLQADHSVAVLAFAKAHKKQVFGEKKSRKFNYGTLKLSKEATRVEFTLDEANVIANLKKLGFAQGVVKEVESIDKNAIETVVPADKREKIGFKVVPTGGLPSLSIDQRSIEILRDAQKQQQKRAS